MTEPSARVLCDSISPAGHRLTTLEVVMHRFVLAEFNTHRAFSRNSASSRAIPLRRTLSRVIDDPAVPVEWRREQRGMQGGEKLNLSDAEVARHTWLRARDDVVSCAGVLDGLGVHKSVVNRLLEPFLWHTVIVSATEWFNFWRQRCSRLAQPEMRAAAEAMRDAYERSTPVELSYDLWHLPLIRDEDWGDLERLAAEEERAVVEVSKDVSAARCARVSYVTHEGVRDVRSDLELSKKLKSARPPHASPFEHVARPTRFQRPGNFTGWVQYRHELWPEPQPDHVLAGQRA